MGAGLVAGRRRDRLPPHRWPDRRPAAGKACRTWSRLDRHRHDRPDPGFRTRRWVPTGLVRPGRRTAGDTGPNARTGHELGRRSKRVGVAVTPTYLDRLAARSATVGTVLCVGIDPDPATLPDGFTADLAGVEQFACLLV